MTDPRLMSSFGLRDLEYDLQRELIAQGPPPERDAARMLVVDRATGTWTDRCVRDLPGLLRAGDALVLNDTRVLPARVDLCRSSGGRIEGLFVRRTGPARWVLMLKGARRCREGETLRFVRDAHPPRWSIRLCRRLGGGRWNVSVTPPDSPEHVLGVVGRAPLPPYIHRPADPVDAGPTALEADDLRRYQTVYARHPGSVAAPTAGLHLTPALIRAIEDRGVAVAYVTLHVGPGTFQPIRTPRVEAHAMHEETFTLPDATAAAVRRCRRDGGRVVAVGTTSARALEHCARPGRIVDAYAGATRLFIHPPRTLDVVDALLTNFHLPRSTLLALVMSLAGVDAIRKAYEHAIHARYRFYSYGDAMFIF